MIGNTTLPDGLTGPFYRSFQKGSEWLQDSVSCFDTPNFINPNIKKEDFKEEKDPFIGEISLISTVKQITIKLRKKIK